MMAIAAVQRVTTAAALQTGRKMTVGSLHPPALSAKKRSRSATHASAACVHARAFSQRPVQRGAAAAAINQALTEKLLNIAAAGLVCLATTGPSCASSSKIGEFSASGLLFKDSVETVALDDPEVSGVTIYISDFRRNIVEKLPFGGDPSQASVTCALTGPIVIRDANKVRGQSGEEVYSEQRKGGLFMRPTLHVRRIFDEAHKTLLYIAYSTGLANDTEENHGRYRTSICALPISSEVAPVEQISANESSGLLS